MVRAKMPAPFPGLGPFIKSQERGVFRTTAITMPSDAAADSETDASTLASQVTCLVVRPEERRESYPVIKKIWQHTKS